MDSWLPPTRRGTRGRRKGRDNERQDAFFCGAVAGAARDRSLTQAAQRSSSEEDPPLRNRGHSEFTQDCEVDDERLETLIGTQLEWSAWPTCSLFKSWDLRLGADRVVTPRRNAARLGQQADRPRPACEQHGGTEQ